MILRAQQVLPISQPPIANGAVVVAGDTITAVGPYRELLAAHGGEVRDLGDVALLPGLINAHCHLDYTDMAGQVPWRGAFLDWIVQITELKRQWTDAQFSASIARGREQLIRSGTTSVINIESSPHLIAALSPSPLRVWWCLELIDLNREDVTEQIVAEAAALISTDNRGTGRYGLSPHAPFTASATLYRRTAELAQARGLLLTTHAAESQDEDDMFRRATGPMAERYRRGARDGVIALLDDCGVLGANCLLAHVNFVTADDVARLQRTGTHVVHCPQTHRFFERGTPPVEALLCAGVNVCLGTDSLASHRTPAALDMFAEMRTLSRCCPSLTPEIILGMATAAPAAALNLAGKLGRLAPGAWADVIAVPLSAGAGEVHEKVVFAEKPVTFALIEGKVVLDGTD